MYRFRQSKIYVKHVCADQVATFESHWKYSKTKKVTQKSVKGISLTFWDLFGIWCEPLICVNQQKLNGWWGHNHDGHFHFPIHFRVIKLGWVNLGVKTNFLKFPPQWVCNQVTTGWQTDQTYRYTAVNTCDINVWSTRHSNVVLLYLATVLIASAEQCFFDDKRDAYK